MIIERHIIAGVRYSNVRSLLVGFLGEQFVFEQV